MGEAFRNGGFGMIPTAIFGLMMVAASIKYAMTPERRFVPLQISLALLTLTSAGFGFVTGLIKSTEAIAGAGDNMRWIWIVGLGESLNNIALALGLGTIAALAAGIGGLRIARGSVPVRS